MSKLSKKKLEDTAKQLTEEAEKRIGMKDADVKDWYFVTRKAAV